MPSKTIEREQITVWGCPNEKLETQYGFVSYAQWLALESHRVEGCELRSTSVDNGRGPELRIALFRDVSLFELMPE